MKFNLREINKTLIFGKSLGRQMNVCIYIEILSRGKCFWGNRIQFLLCWKRELNQQLHLHDKWCFTEEGKGFLEFYNLFFLVIGSRASHSCACDWINIYWFQLLFGRRALASSERNVGKKLQFETVWMVKGRPKLPNGLNGAELIEKLVLPQTSSPFLMLSYLIPCQHRTFNCGSHYVCWDPFRSPLSANLCSQFIHSETANGAL